MADEIRDVLKEFFDQEEDRRRERIDLLRWKFENDHESLTDRDRLELVGLMVRYPEIERGQYPDQLVAQLSFVDPTIALENLKTAWKDFLTSGELPEEWNSTCDLVMARCFEQLGKTMHATSVYEYMLSQMIGGDPNYRVYAEDCLFRLFEYYLQRKPSRRAREILMVITEYHENGLVSDDRYYDALLKETELFFREIGEAVDRDRHLVEERLRLLLDGTFEKLHPTTRGYLVDAELWSDDRMQSIEPLAGPLRWALAIEAEFLHKVYAPHKKEVAAALGRSASPPKSCGPRDISNLLKQSLSRELVGTVISKVFKGLTGNSALASIANLDALEVICEHRNQIAHVTTSGPYNLERCRALTKIIKESDWIYTFLASLQPAGAK